MSRRPVRTGVAVAAILLLGSVAACSLSGSSSSSPSPASSASAASGAATAQPSDAVLPGASEASDASRLVARFLEVMSSPDLRYRTTATTTIAVGNSTIDQVITGVVADPDVDLTIAVTGGSSDQHSEVAVVDGTAYQRDQGGAWQASGDPAQISAIGRDFAFLEGDVLADAGRELSGGSFVRHLTLRKPIPIDDAVKGALAIATTSGTVDTFDLLLDADGTPVEFRAGLSFSVDLGGTTGPTDVQAQVVQTYEDVGGDDVAVNVTGLPKP